MDEFDVLKSALNKIAWILTDKNLPPSIKIAKALEVYIETQMVVKPVSPTP